MVHLENLKALMKEQNIRNVDLAEAVGVSEAMIGYIVRGLKEPSLAVLRRIATALGCGVKDLIDED